MTTNFFPDTCGWIYPDKDGNLKYCESSWTHISEPELWVFCDTHYQMYLKIREKHGLKQS